MLITSAGQPLAGQLERRLSSRGRLQEHVDDGAPAQRRDLLMEREAISRKPSLSWKRFSISATLRSSMEMRCMSVPFRPHGTRLKGSPSQKDCIAHRAATPAMRTTLVLDHHLVGAVGLDQMHHYVLVSAGGHVLAHKIRPEWAGLGVLDRPAPPGGWKAAVRSRTGLRFAARMVRPCRARSSTRTMVLSFTSKGRSVECTFGCSYSLPSRASMSSR